MNVSRRALLAGGGTAVAGALSGCLGSGGERDVTESVEERFETADVDRIAVSTEEGDVTVRGEDRETIDVTGTKRAAGENHLDDVELTGDRSDGRLDLSVERESAIIRLGPDPIMDLEIAVPTGLRVEAIDATNGRIEAADVAGDLRIDGTNGDITASAIDGALAVDTTNGRVEATDVAGDCTVETTNGGIEIVDPRGAVDVETTNGEVSVTGADGDCTVETTNGEVRVTVTDADATLDLSADNGGITVDGFGEGRIRNESSYEGTFGAGTDRVEVEITNGDVRVAVAE